MKQEQSVQDYLLFPFSSIGSTSSAYFTEPKWSIVWYVDLTRLINPRDEGLYKMYGSSQHCYIKICMLLSFRTEIKHALNAFLSIPCYWIITYHIYLRILSNSIFTHMAQFSSELYNQQNILNFVFCTVHCDIIIQHEPMKCVLFPFFNF